MFSSKYFNMGKVVCTATLHNTMSENSRFAKEVIMAINRYSNKDWGELTEDDQQVNEDALQYPDDLYLLGAYKTCKGWLQAPHHGGYGTYEIRAGGGVPHLPRL